MTTPTVASIVKSAKARISELQQQDSRIDAKIDSIKDKEWDKPLSKQERAELLKLRTAKALLLETMEELGYITVGAIDKSDEMVRIANALTGISSDLAKRTRELKAAGVEAKNFGDTLAGINKIVSSMASLTSRATKPG